MNYFRPRKKPLMPFDREMVRWEMLLQGSPKQEHRPWLLNPLLLQFANYCWTRFDLVVFAQVGTYCTLPSSAAVLQTARWHTCHDVTRLSAVSLSNLAARSLVWRATYLLPSPHSSWVHSEHQTPVLTSVWRDFRECERLELDGGGKCNGPHDSDDCGSVEIKISTN